MLEYVTPPAEIQLSGGTAGTFLRLCRTHKALKPHDTRPSEENRGSQTPKRNGQHRVTPIAIPSMSACVTHGHTHYRIRSASRASNLSDTGSTIHHKHKLHISGRTTNDRLSGIRAIPVIGDRYKDPSCPCPTSALRSPLRPATASARCCSVRTVNVRPGRSVVRELPPPDPA